MSPVVLMNTTARYGLSPRSVNTLASSVASTAKPFSWPSFRTAAIPVSMDEWRNPAVLEKTSTRGAWRG